MQQDQKKQPEGGLIASSLWQDVCRQRGQDVHSLGAEHYGTVQRLPIAGSYLYTPRAVVSTTNNVPRAARWVRCDAATDADMATLKATGKKVLKAPHDMQPRTHLIMSLAPTEDELLAAMKAKTRYNIRLAEKKGVVVHYVTRTDQDFAQMLDVFYDMVRATEERKGVAFHSRAYYQSIFDAVPEEHVALFVAEIGGVDFIAANIVSFYNGTATYLHGATGQQHRNAMAPFALQWAAITAAKARGCTYYDFGGVYPESTDAGKAGITRFKKGFAPAEEYTQLHGSYDLVLRPLWYSVYRVLEMINTTVHKLRRKKV